MATAELQHRRRRRGNWALPSQPSSSSADDGGRRASFLAAHLDPWRRPKRPGSRTEQSVNWPARSMPGTGHDSSKVMAFRRRAPQGQQGVHSGRVTEGTGDGRGARPGPAASATSADR